VASTLKILSWNIRQGGGTRTDDILKSVYQHNPHIIIFSEFRNNQSGAMIRTRLMMKGYSHQFVTAAQKQTNSVLIASKLHGDSQLFYDEVKDFPESVVMLKTSGIEIYGLYLPHKKKHELFKFLLHRVAEGNPVILAGDFNTGVNGVDQKGDSFWYSEYLGKLEEANVFDAFRHFHPEAEEYSWYSHGGNGFRYDHTWVHDSLKPFLADCSYSHQEREAGTSDHSVMLLELQV